MSELRDLYQDLILDHGRNPRNKRAIPGAREARGHNPLCGDQITVYVVVEGGVVKDVSFDGAGCAISTAAASMMTQVLKGKTREEAEHLFHAYHAVVTGKVDLAEASDELGKLVVFAGVSEFPIRVKCATLAWHTMHAALEESGQTVSTE